MPRCGSWSIRMWHPGKLTAGEGYSPASQEVHNGVVRYRRLVDLFAIWSHIRYRAVPLGKEDYHTHLSLNVVSTLHICRHLFCPMLRCSILNPKTRKTDPDMMTLLSIWSNEREPVLPWIMREGSFSFLLVNLVEHMVTTDLRCWVLLRRLICHYCPEMDAGARWIMSRTGCVALFVLSAYNPQGVEGRLTWSEIFTIFVFLVHVVKRG
mmetsp:Transcript_14881/g.30276  ORF Transcript_14881/g.30276 Transcript_14881/m.30276 type:complete len:209 (+) Transcript_14881:1562-2188(+)